MTKPLPPPLFDVAALLKENQELRSAHRFRIRLQDLLNIKLTCKSLIRNINHILKLAGYKELEK